MLAQLRLFKRLSRDEAFYSGVRIRVRTNRGVNLSKPVVGAINGLKRNKFQRKWSEVGSMPFSYSVSLHMLHLIRTSMKFACNTPRPSKNIHYFANNAAFFIRLDQSSNKDDIANRE